MNKKLIAMGIAAALAAPLAAQAGVEVYGKARVSVDMWNDGGTYSGTASTTTEKSGMSVSSNASRLGFKGDEDLGGGLSALWTIEEGVNFDTNTSFGADQRPTYVGLAGGFGTVVAGRLDAPYKSSTNSWDPFQDTKADYNNIMGGGRVSNALAYMSNDMNGLSFDLAYVMPSTDSTQTKLSKKQTAYDLGVNYSQGPLAVILGYEVGNKLGGTPSTAPASADPDNATMWKLGAKYMIMDATSLALIYENVDVGGDTKDRNNIYFAATHKMGDTTLKLAYTNSDKCGGTTATCNKTAASQVSLGVTQALSKNTEVYALYSQISNDDNRSAGFTGGPAAGTKTSGSGDPSVLSFGINHNFSSK